MFQNCIRKVIYNPADLRGFDEKLCLRGADLGLLLSACPLAPQRAGGNQAPSAALRWRRRATELACQTSRTARSS